MNWADSYLSQTSIHKTNLTPSTESTTSFNSNPNSKKHVKFIIAMWLFLTTFAFSIHLIFDTYIMPLENLPLTWADALKTKCDDILWIGNKQAMLDMG